MACYDIEYSLIMEKSQKSNAATKQMKINFAIFYFTSDYYFTFTVRMSTYYIQMLITRLQIARFNQ